MNKIIPLFAVLFLIFIAACDSTETTVIEKTKTPFVSKKIMIDLNFNPYSDSVVIDVMSDVGLCFLSPDTTLPDSIQQLPCDYRIFRVFMNHANNNWKDGFLVELKGGIITESYRILNISLIDGKYAVTNEYFGELLEMRTTESGNYAMIIRYVDREIGTVAILHEWNKNHYEPISVEEVNDHFVKAEKKDSLNELYIKNFVWGF